MLFHPSLLPCFLAAGSHLGLTPVLKAATGAWLVLGPSCGSAQPIRVSQTGAKLDLARLCYVKGFFWVVLGRGGRSDVVQGFIFGGVVADGIWQGCAFLARKRCEQPRTSCCTQPTPWFSAPLFPAQVSRASPACELAAFARVSLRRVGASVSKWLHASLCSGVHALRCLVRRRGVFVLSGRVVLL